MLKILRQQLFSKLRRVPNHKTIIHRTPDGREEKIAEIINETSKLRRRETGGERYICFLDVKKEDVIFEMCGGGMRGFPSKWSLLICWANIVIIFDVGLLTFQYF